MTGRLYRGNWPHDGSVPPKFEPDDSVIVEMEHSRSWGPENCTYHVAADLEDVEARLEKYVKDMAKDLLNAVNVAKISGSEDLKGWPLGAVAKVKSFECRLELEYTDPGTRYAKKTKKGARDGKVRVRGGDEGPSGEDCE